MAPPWAESQTRVVIEFLRGGDVCNRQIYFRHRADTLPAQLYGRMPPEMWAAFMTDCNQLATIHPYVVRPGAGRCCEWFGHAILGLVFGCCCLNGDGGDFNIWIPQVETMLNKYRPALTQAGLMATLQSAQGSYWIQLDVDPNSMAVGQPLVQQYAYSPAPYGVPAAVPPPHKG